MASPNERGSKRPFSWLSALSAFDRDDSGTALTEFIITLPVFIIIWAGMLNLYQIERQSMRTKIMASKATWENAMEVAKGGLHANPDVGVPMVAAGNQVSAISEFPSENGDMNARLKNIGLMSNGTAGEANRATTGLGGLGQNPPGAVPGQNLNAYPRDMIDDSQWNMLTSAPGPLGAYIAVLPLSFMGPNQTPAAGMRYGSSVGESEITFEVAGQTMTFEAAYDVLNTPVAKPLAHEDAVVVPGFSRLMAEDDPCLSSVLELSANLSYINNCL